jgi:uncharacterized membrane protein YozB (DUF420 family)
MNLYLEPHGFLGNGASLLADITVIAYLVLIIPAMIAGLVFARRKMHRPHHKWTMTTIAIVNWIVIVFLMLVAYRFDVAPNITTQPDNTRYLLPTIHALFGLPAQLLATFLVLRMFREDSQVARAKARGETNMSKYWFKYAKPVMRLTLTLWLITAVLGVVSYLIRYELVPAYTLDGKIAAPAATPEILAPLETPEIGAPVETSEASAPAETPEVPVATEELQPGETQELSADTATRRSSPTRTVRAPVVTEEISPVQTQEVGMASNTPTRRPTSTRVPIATRTVRAPVETEEVTPVVTPELER